METDYTQLDYTHLIEELTQNQEEMLIILQNLQEITINSFSNLHTLVTVIIPLITIVVLFWWFIRQFIR